MKGNSDCPIRAPAARNPTPTWAKGPVSASLRINGAPDPDRIPAANIKGKAQWIVPFVGLLHVWAGPGTVDTAQRHHRGHPTGALAITIRLRCRAVKRVQRSQRLPILARCSFGSSLLLTPSFCVDLSIWARPRHGGALRRAR